MAELQTIIYLLIHCTVAAFLAYLIKKLNIQLYPGEVFSAYFVGIAASWAYDYYKAQGKIKEMYKNILKTMQEKSKQEGDDNK